MVGVLYIFPHRRILTKTRKEKTMNGERKEKDIQHSSKSSHIYFSMNMPDWFINKPASEKCEIVKALADQLKDEKPISPEQRKKLFSIN